MRNEGFSLGFIGGLQPSVLLAKEECQNPLGICMIWVIEDDSYFSPAFTIQPTFAQRSPASRSLCQCSLTPGCAVESRLLDPPSRSPARSALVADPGGQHGCEAKLVENKSPPFGTRFGIHHQHANGIPIHAYAFQFHPRNVENGRIDPYLRTSLVC